MKEAHVFQSYLVGSKKTWSAVVPVHLEDFIQKFDTFSARGKSILPKRNGNQRPSRIPIIR